MSKLDTGAFGRGTLGDEIGSEASSRKGENWILLVAIHQQSSRDIQCSNLFSGRRYKEFAVCSTIASGI